MGYQKNVAIDRLTLSAGDNRGCCLPRRTHAGRGEDDMDLQLNGKRALVSGSSSGLGAAIALELAREGVSLVVHGRDRERAEHTAREARALGADAIAVTGDLSRDDEADA